MGQNIQKTFSCVDCGGSRIGTLEDFESSYNIRVKDFQSFDYKSDMDDEFTVFESPVKPQLNRLYKRIEEEKVFESQNVSIKPKNRLYTNSDRKIEKIQITGFGSEKKNEELVGSEISTPSLVTNGSRYRAYSSNLSPISMNLVDSIRKDSVSSDKRMDSSPKLVNKL